MNVIESIDNKTNLDKKQIESQLYDIFAKYFEE